MNKNSAVLILSTGLLTCNALAGTTRPSDWVWVGTLSAGSVWANAGNTQTFYLAPGIEKTYAANRSTDIFFDGEVFAGLQKKLSQILQGQIGLAVMATSNTTLSGEIWDDADSLFNNYAYQYKIQHAQVALKSKLLANMSYWLIPWVSGSIGVGFNNAKAFQNTPLIFEAVTNPNFASHTETAFSYTVGAGVQKILNTHWQVGLGYEFVDWGKSTLNRAATQTLNSGLSLNHFYTNGVLFNLTYLA